MPTIDLSAGPIDVVDTGGTGPVVVLLHGMVMSATLWDEVVEALRSDRRCVVPTLPLGAHATPMKPEADLSPQGTADLVLDLLEEMDLEEVTLVGVDTGGALAQLMVGPRDGRIARLVLASSDAYDNFPPGLPGKTIAIAARPPGGLWLSMQLTRPAFARRLPMTWGWMSKKPISNQVYRGWMRPLLSNRGVRRDAKKFLRGVDRRQLVEAADRLPSFDRPALVVWATEDRVMPLEHGRRLAAALPQGRLVEIPDSYTLIPIDQPQALSNEIRSFATASPDPSPRS